MATTNRRFLLGLLFAGIAGSGLLSAEPAYALSVDELAHQIAAGQRADAIQLAVDAAMAQGMSVTDIAQAYGRAFRMLEQADASDDARSAMLTSYETFKSGAGAEIALLDAAFMVGVGRVIAAFTPGGGGGAAPNMGYAGPTGTVSASGNNSSPH